MCDTAAIHFLSLWYWVCYIKLIEYLDSEVTQRFAHYVHYLTWDRALCTAGVAPSCFFLSEFVSMPLLFFSFFLWGKNHYGPINVEGFFFSQPGQGCLFSLMSAVSFIVPAPTILVLMVHDLYHPDACLYSAKREDLAWGGYYSSFSNRAKWALLFSMDKRYHSTQFKLKAIKHKQI